jgi:hypothetical protein
MQIRFNFTAVSIGNTRCMQMRPSVGRPLTCAHRLSSATQRSPHLALLSILIQLGRAQKAGQTKPTPGVNCGPNAQCGNNSAGALFNAMRPMLRRTRSERELGAHLKCTPSISGALFSRLFRSASISRALSQNIKCPLC